MQDFGFFQKYTEFQTWVKKSFSRARAIDLNVFKTPFTQKGFVVLFVLAFGFGVLIKSQVNDVITIGYDDYKVKDAINIEDLNKIQREMIESGKSFTLNESTLPQGETCSE